jgi:hypothetical protein
MLVTLTTWAGHQVVLASLEIRDSIMVSAIEILANGVSWPRKITDVHVTFHDSVKFRVLPWQTPELDNLIPAKGVIKAEICTPTEVMDDGDRAHAGACEDGHRCRSAHPTGLGQGEQIDREAEEQEREAAGARHPESACRHGGRSITKVARPASRTESTALESIRRGVWNWGGRSVSMRRAESGERSASTTATAACSSSSLTPRAGAMIARVKA